MKTIRILLFFGILFFSACQIIVEERVNFADFYTGTYEADEWSESMAIQSYFNIYIYADRFDRDIVYIDNFYNADMEIYAEINGYKLRIPRQIAGYYEVEGIGSLNGDQLTMDYSVRDIDNYSNYIDYCHAICVRY